MTRDEALALLTSGSTGVQKWNSERSEAPPPELIGADLSLADLAYADLSGVDLTGANLSGATLDRADLSGATLENANLTGITGDGVDLAGVLAHHVDLRNATFSNANFQGAILKNADFREAKLTSCDLSRSDLTRVDLRASKLESGSFNGTNLSYSRVDGLTLFHSWVLDRDTNATGVGLASARIEPAILSSLTRNTRLHYWKAQYHRKPIRTVPIRIFYALSDYGESTLRIASTFVVSTMLFALFYCQISTLLDGERFEPSLVRASDNTSQAVIRLLYFSTVTTTTLGFGDVHPGATSSFLQLTVAVQAVFGYVILGLVLTRLSNLYSSPA